MMEERCSKELLQIRHSLKTSLVVRNDKKFSKDVEHVATSQSSK
jgi:hypothetical protein